MRLKTSERCGPGGAQAGAARYVWAMIFERALSVARSYPLLVVLVFLGFAFHALDSSFWAVIGSPSLQLNGSFLFHQLPQALHLLVASHPLLLCAGLIGLNVMGSWLTLYGFAAVSKAADAMALKLAVEAGAVLWRNVAIDCAFRTLVFLPCAGTVLIIYLICAIIFRNVQSEILVYVLTCALFLIFVAYFAATACFSFLLQVKSAQGAINGLRRLKAATARDIYAFYFVRISIEATLGASVAAVASRYVSSSWLAPIVAAVIICLPLLIFRTAGVVFKRRIFGIEHD